MVDAGTGPTLFEDLPVNLLNPLTQATTYVVTVEMAGFDTSDALRSAGLLAGAKPPITLPLEFGLPEFGTITGTVVGRVNPAPTFEPLPLSPLLSLTATRVARLDGSPPPIGEPALVAAVDPTDPNGFVFSGPPGFYRIDVSHEHYQPVPFSVPPAAPDSPPPGTYYKLVNEVANDLSAPFVLEIEPGTISLTVVEDQSLPLDGVAVVVNDPEAVVTPTTAGTYVVSNITPGSVILELRRRTGDPPEDTHFPVIASITVPRGSEPADRVIAVGAVMPRIGGSITGTVIARNSEGDLFPLPQVTLTRTYDPPDVVAGGTTIPNTATEADAIPIPPPQVILGPEVVVPPATPVPQAFTFPDLAVGVHVVTALDVPGYTTPTIGPVLVDSVSVATPVTDGPPVGQLSYVANPVDVVVAVTSTAGTNPPLVDAVVTLTPPGGGDALLPTTEDPAGTFTFTDVIPDPLEYSLTVTAPFHTSETSSLFVLPDADGTLANPVDLAPASATISGRARKEGSGGTADLAAGEGTIRLFKLGAPPDTVGVEVPVVSPTTPGTGGLYTFTVTEAGNYRVQVELAGHATRSTTVTGVVLGQPFTAADITVLAYASAEITVTGGATTAADLTAVVTEPAGSGLVALRVGNVFVFNALDPEVLYRFQVRATGYVSVNVPTSVALDPTIGGLHVFTVQPQHLLLVTVTTEDDSGAENTATVDVRIPSGTVVATQTGTDSNVYRFVELPPGAGDVVVTRSGYRTRTVAFANSHTAINIPVELKPLVTISGTVTDGTAPVAGVTVNATDGTTTATDVTDDDGAYSIPGLNIGAWTVSALVPGTGTDSETVTVTQDSATSVTTNLVLEPRDLAFVFHVTSGGTDVAGAMVTLDTAGPTATDATGNVTLTVPEDGPLAWTVTSPTHITQIGTATPTLLAVPVALVARPTLNGTVSNAGGVVVGATVYLCPAAATLCAAATAVDTETTIAGGAFSFLPDAGPWEVRAVSGATSSPETPVTVTPAGVATPNPVPLIVA